MAPVSRFHSSVPLSHSSPSLIGLLVSVDVKQQKINQSNRTTFEESDLCGCPVAIDERHDQGEISDQQITEKEIKV